MYGAASGGTSLGTVDLSDVAVTDGLFTVQLDYGEGVFTGDPRYLEVVINGETLSPRQQVTAVPYAIHAGTADTALNATSAETALNATSSETANTAWWLPRRRVCLGPASPECPPALPMRSTKMP